MRGALTGLGGGIMWLIIYSSYALAFWFGVKLVMDDRQKCIEEYEECHVRYDASRLIIVTCIACFIARRKALFRCSSPC